MRYKYPLIIVTIAKRNITITINNDDIFRIAGEPSLKEALRSVETETEFLSFSKSKGVF